MKSVWITGVNCYEVSGLVALLKAEGVVARIYRPGSRFCEGDRLIICLSGVPLLGWWRYLKILEWLMRRYENASFLVLCPEAVYDSGVIYGENIMSVNGRVDLTLLTESLLLYLRNELSGEVSGIVQRPGRRRGEAGFRNVALWCLRIRPTGAEEGIQLRREYRLRAQLLRETGFYTILTLEVFMAGFPV